MFFKGRKPANPMRRRCTGIYCIHPRTRKATPHIMEENLGEAIGACNLLMEKITTSTPVVRLLEPNEAALHLELSDVALRKIGFVRLGKVNIWEIGKDMSLPTKRQPNQRPRACKVCSEYLNRIRKAGKIIEWHYKIACLDEEEIGVIHSEIIVVK